MLYSAKDALDGWVTYAGWKKRISKDLLYGKLEKGACKTGCPLLHFKDVCKRDMKSAAIDIESWELMVKDRSSWRHHLRGNQAYRKYTKHVTSGEEKYQKSHGYGGTT